MNPLLALGPAELRTLAFEARVGRLDHGDVAALGRYVAKPEEVGSALGEMGVSGWALAGWLDLLAEAAEKRRAVEDVCKLVVTGPDESHSRATQTVVRELFREAESSVWVCGYRPYEAREIFAELARPGLMVRMLLDVGPALGREEARVVEEFLSEFRLRHWPASADLPEIWYDPMALLPDGAERGVAHAKCVVADGRRLFVTSANFTEAAQNRNIEAGLLVESKALARQMTEFLEGLIREGRVRAAGVRNRGSC